MLATNDDGRTVLHEAAQRGTLDEDTPVSLLVSEGMVDINAKCNAGLAALAYIKQEFERRHSVPQ